jgi:YtxH-like protein
MYQNQIRNLMSIGAALASGAAFKSVSASPVFSDPLSIIGLERRSPRLVERTALVGIGLLVGAGAALFFAPYSGTEMRRRVSSKVDGLAKEAQQLGERASDYLSEVADAAVQQTASLSHTNGRNSRAINPS